MTFLHSSHLAHVFTNVTRTDTTQKSSHTDLGHSKAAGEKGTKHVKRVWQGLTIFKPDLAFLKPGVRHPSFPLQRHKHSFLPVQRPAHQKERRKNEEKTPLEDKEGCVSLSSLTLTISTALSTGAARSVQSQ